MSQWDDSEQTDPYTGDGGNGNADPVSDPFIDGLNALYQRYYQRDATADEIATHRGNPKGLAGVEDLLKASQAGAAPTPGDSNPTPTPTPTPTPAPTPGPGSGSITQPFTEPYASPNPQPLPTIGGSAATIPGAPDFPTIPKFSAPTVGDAMADPGYQFTLQQGNDNLTNWLASRGMQNDSSAAKAFIDYGQGAASTQYGNVWDRALRGYEENVGTQYVQPWQAQYQNWVTGTVNPTMTNFQTNAANVSHLNDVSWQDNWNKWLQDWNVFRDQRDSTFDKQFQVATS